jgi:ribosome-associated protein
VQLSRISISSLLRIPISELEFRTSRSGGPGGQNVNKLETRVEVRFDIRHSKNLSPQVRDRLLQNLARFTGSPGVLRIVVQESRSQWKNKQLAIERLTALLRSALVARKKRTATKPTAPAREARLRTKRIRGERKRLRKVEIE